MKRSILSLAVLLLVPLLFAACAGENEPSPAVPAADPGPAAAQTEPAAPPETEPAETEPAAESSDTLRHSDAALYEDNLAKAIEYAKTIHDLYWDSGTCLSKLTPDGGTPHLWPYTEESSMVNGILLAMDKEHPDRAFFEQYLRETMDGLRYYRIKKVGLKEVNGEYWNDPDYKMAKYGESDGTPHSYAIYAASRSDRKMDSAICMSDGVYFDDNVWVAKSFYYAYINTGDMVYLNEATNIMNWILGEGYETRGALNGIYWKWSSKFRFPANSTSDTDHASLNTCSTASSALVLTKLAAAIEGTPLEGLRDRYLSAAADIFEFCRDALVDKSTKCLYDKVILKKGFENETDLKKQVQKTDTAQYAYNTGTYLTAGADLYAMLRTSDPERADAILEAALASAKGADKKFADRNAKKGQYSYPSHSWFTSFLAAGFSDLAAYDEGCAEYVEHMRSALDYAWQFYKAKDGLVSPAWIKGWGEFSGKTGTNEDNPRQILFQSANAHCYAMLARYYR